MFAVLSAGCFANALSMAFPASAAAAEFHAAGYVFSDELGGFRLLGATGNGTAADPVVIVEEFDEATPATLVIRRDSDPDRRRPRALLTLTLEKVVTNLSGRVWAGFEVELQEKRKKPSVYGDGLSFNQFGAQPQDASSDSFVNNDRAFEPYDRILFQNGFVDPGKTAQFRLTITDPTPVPVFYLVEDPKLLSAGIDGDRRFAAGPTY